MEFRLFAVQKVYVWPSLSFECEEQIFKVRILWDTKSWREMLASKKKLKSRMWVLLSRLYFQHLNANGDNLTRFEESSKVWMTNLEPGRLSLRRRAQWWNGVLMFELKPSSWHWAGDQDHRLLSLREMRLTTNQRPSSRALHQSEIRKVSPGALPAVHNKEVAPWVSQSGIGRWALWDRKTMIWSQDPSFLHRILMSSKLSHCAILRWGLRGINVKYR